MNTEIPPPADLPAHPRRSTSRRELIQSVVELLRRGEARGSALEELLGRLATSVDQWMSSRRGDGTYDAALQNAPWLTSDVERLKRDQAALRQSLQSFQLQRTHLDDSEASVRQLSQQFEDFAAQLVDCEVAEQTLLHNAYPGPSWVLED